MKKILLVCNAGMSTSLLVINMEKAAKKLEIDAQILAIPLTQVDNTLNTDVWEVMMLGPQVRHELRGLKARHGEKLPIEIIDMRDYGMMNGEKVLKKALEVIENIKK